MNTQLPLLWEHFVKEWDNHKYAPNFPLFFLLLICVRVTKSKAVKSSQRSRYLFLFGVFLRSIQFLTVIGFTLDSLYTLLDKSLVIAEAALDGTIFSMFSSIYIHTEFSPNGTTESAILLRNIILLYSALVVVSRRVNPFRYFSSRLND